MWHITRPSSLCGRVVSFQEFVGFWITRRSDWHIVTNVTKEFSASSLGPKLSRTLPVLEGESSGSFDLQSKAIRYFENAADTRKSTNHNIPEYRSENLEPHNIVSGNITGTGDRVLVCRSPRITLSMKLTWNELTSKSGLPLVRSMVSKPQAQHCELPLWSSHSTRA